MKIVEIIFSLSPGGAERFVVDLSNELCKDNEVVLITLKNDTIDSENRKFYCFDIDKNVKYLNLGIPDGFHILSLWTIYRAIKKERPDVVHLHLRNIVNYCLLAIIFLCKKIVFVQTIHIDFKVGHDSLVYKFLFKVIGKKHRMRWAALSKSNYEDLIHAYPNILGKQIDNGRAPIKPTDKFNDVTEEILRLRKDHKTKIFLHVARCAEQKNQSLLIDAFNKFTTNGYNAILLVVGTGFEEEIGKKLRAKSNANIYFLGPRKNISDYMLQADYFCLSSWYEGFPITMIEAILSGVPIISTPFKGVSDIIKNNVNGIISKSFEMDDYLTSLITSYNQHSYLSGEAKKEASISPFTIKACAEKYIEFFRE